MSTTTATTLSSCQMIAFSENHQAIFEIIVNSFNQLLEWPSVVIFHLNLSAIHH